jgi:hypothetical protein
VVICLDLHGGRGGEGGRRRSTAPEAGWLASWLAFFLIWKGWKWPWEGIWELTAWAERGREAGGIGESGRAELWSRGRRDPGVDDLQGVGRSKKHAGRRQQQQQVEIREPGVGSQSRVVDLRCSVLQLRVALVQDAVILCC